MAKRPLGLSKSNKAKRAKQNNGTAANESTESKESTPQLTLEVEEGEDPEDELVQLRALWKTYFHEERQSEQLLNGIINECNSKLIKSDEDNSKLDTDYLAIFAFALVESIYTEDGYHSEIHELFERAKDVTTRGFSQDSKNELLRLTFANICFTRIITEYISQLKPDSTSLKDNTTGKEINLYNLLKDGMNKFSLYTKDLPMTFEVLNEFGTLLELVSNFNSSRSVAEDGLDSDVEEDEEDEDEDEEKAENVIPVSHPLYEIRTHVRDLFEWQRVKMIELYESLKLQKNLESESEKFKLNVVTTIGELYLKRAAAPMRKFLKLRYGDDEENIDSDLCKESQQDAIDSIASALEYLRMAQDPDSTDSWVTVAEAYIDLGNVCDNESTEQENAYGEAEKLLRKANIAAHGRYDDVLSRFLQDQAE